MRIAVAALASLFVVAGCSSDTPADTSSEDTTPRLSVLALEVGSCLNDVDQPISQDMTEIPEVDCRSPHQSEVFAEIAIHEESFPGIDELVARAEAACLEQFAGFIGVAYEDSALSFHYYYPTFSSWSVGDRSIFCVAYEPGVLTEGTLENAMR